jgi:hypothetical protein
MKAIDYHIELVPRIKPPSQAPYRMSPMEELIDSGFIYPSKALYGAPVLFQKKADESLTRAFACVWTTEHLTR